MKLRGLTTLLLTMACASPALAGDSPCGFRLWPCCWTRVCPSLGGSPDDYCRKPYPTIIPVSRCGGPDDYCRKAAPCIPCVPRCGGVDDYCRKNIPCLLCPPISPHLYYGSIEPYCVAPRHR